MIKFLLGIIRILTFIVLIPVRIVGGIQYMWAFTFYPKETLVLDKRWKIGHHVINDKNNKKCIVLRTSKIDRGRCPAWYKTRVAIKPSK